MFKKFQWSGERGVYNIIELETLEGQGINRMESLNFYGYWNQKRTKNIFSYRWVDNPFFENEIWTLWIKEDEVLKWMDSIDERIFIIMSDYIKLKRKSLINYLLDEHPDL
jgi:hypothetical protein